MRKGASTKERIITLLKKSGGMSAEALSQAVGITTMGVRQHLMGLKRQGLVSIQAQRHGIGRPMFIYRLTEQAQAVFPKAYHRLAVELLEAVERLEGRQKVEELFRYRKDRLVAELGPKVSGRASRLEQAQALVQALNEQGHMAELRRRNGSLLLSFYNCPIYRVAQQYAEACRVDLEMLQDLLGRDLRRLSCMARGDSSCSFLLPKASVPPGPSGLSAPGGSPSGP